MKRNSASCVMISARWTARAEQGGEQINALKARLAETEAEYNRVAGVPEQLRERRKNFSAN